MLNLIPILHPKDCLLEQRDNLVDNVYELHVVLLELDASVKQLLSALSYAATPMVPV
jgi:hypothetical protein